MVNTRKLASKDILLYTGTRYFEFVLKFFYGVLIAKVLGPELFGVWGFLMLVQQYLLNAGLGFQHVVTVELSNKSTGSAAEQERLIANALGATLAVAVLVSLLALTLQVGYFNLFAKFQLDKYAFLMALMVGTMNIGNVLLCAYRVYGDVQKISMTQLLRVAVPLCALFFYEGEMLITTMITAMLVSNLIGIALFMHQSPFRIYLAIEPGMVKKLLILGLPLLVYNVAFNLIMNSGRTILSIYYPVETMGQYSFASSITNATLLGFKSIVFVLMPNIIHQTRQDVDNVRAGAMVKRVNAMYSTGVFLAAWGIILFQPLLFAFVPDFRLAGMSVSVLMLAQAVLSATFGYNTLALSRGHQLDVAKISLLAVLFVVVTGIAVAEMGLSFDWISVCVLGGAYVFAVLQTKLGAHLIDQPHTGLSYWKDALSPGNCAAILIFLVGSWLGYTQVAGYVGTAIFLFANRAELKLLWVSGVLRKGRA